MPMYQYSAYGQGAKRVRGKVKAANQAAAEESLYGLGLYVTQIREAKDEQWWNKDIVVIGRKVKVRDFALFCRQLATLIRAGVTLLDSITVIASQTNAKPLQHALEVVAEDVSEGRSFSDAVSKHPDIFQAMFISVVRAGEVAGNMDDALDRLARSYEKDYYTREKVKSALTYPIVLGVLSILVSVFILVKIVPTFVPVFASYNTALPLPTRLVLGLSQLLQHNWWIVILVVVLLLGSDVIGRRRTKYKVQRDKILLRIPVFGGLYQKTLMARMSRTLGSLLSSAVPMLQSLTIVKEVVNNQAVGDALEASVSNLQEGRSFATPFKTNKHVPPMVSQMIAIGEESGNLELMLAKLADFYEAEVEETAERLRTLIEPIMILFLAGIIGVIVLAVMMPSFSLLQTLQ